MHGYFKMMANESPVIEPSGLYRLGQKNAMFYDFLGCPINPLPPYIDFFTLSECFRERKTDEKQCALMLGACAKMVEKGAESYNIDIEIYRFLQIHRVMRDSLATYSKEEIEKAAKIIRLVDEIISKFQLLKSVTKPLVGATQFLHRLYSQLSEMLDVDCDDVKEIFTDVQEHNASGK
jgi:predicted transcriptional regulator